MGDHDPALGHHLLPLTEAKREAVVKPHAITDELCRVAKPSVRRRLDGHQPQPLLTPEQPDDHSSRRKLTVPSRVLALIKPGTESRLLVVERLSRVDDPDDEYEAVNVAEYFGGDDFDSVAALIVFQLKYSTRHPDQPWTAARLCRPWARRRADGLCGRGSSRADR